MRHFIAARDELLFQCNTPPGRLVPYQPGLPCLHWQAVIETPDEEARVLAFITSDESADRPARD